ncbi:hypothetical protein ACIQVA_20290 [Streptomyces microflavus]|uniref:hypothetical protein n=1 Tax=Streptomyces microflavus TaxID=1919 RepID=UPI003812A654
MTDSAEMLLDEVPDGPEDGWSFESWDLLLETLLFMVEKTDTTFSVMLHVNGGVVTGTLIGSSAWVKALTASIRVASGGEVLGSALEKGLNSATDGNLSRLGSGVLHLRDATYRNGTMTVTSPLWRGPIDHLSGWSLEGTVKLSSDA